MKIVMMCADIARVFIRPIGEEYDPEDVLEKYAQELGFHASDCTWMVVASVEDISIK